MLTREGTAKDFKDLALQYIAFLQCDSDDTIAWDLLDNRLDTYYGATLSIPHHDYTVRESSYIEPFDEKSLPYKRGTIVNYMGHNYRQLLDDCMDNPVDNPNAWHKIDTMQITVFFDNGVYSEYTKDFNSNVVKKNNKYFVHTFNRVLPNSAVTAVNLDTLITANNPKGHINYVANPNHNIDKLIVFVNRFGITNSGACYSHRDVGVNAYTTTAPIHRYDDFPHHDGDIVQGMDGWLYLNTCDANKPTPTPVPPTDCYCVPKLHTDHWKLILPNSIPDNNYAQQYATSKVAIDSGASIIFDTQQSVSNGGKGFHAGDIVMDDYGNLFLNINKSPSGVCTCFPGINGGCSSSDCWTPIGALATTNTRTTVRSLQGFINNMEELDYECYMRGIDVEYIYAPSLLDADSIGYVESIDFINFVNNYITKYSKKKIHNFFTDILVKFDPLFLSHLSSKYICNSTPNHLSYKKSVASLLTRYLMNVLFHTSVEEIFVSFHTNEIDSNTYYNFIYNNDEYMSEELYKLQAYTRSIRSKYSPLNPFKNAGSLMSVGVHTSFDYNVWMSEQGGITCKRESDRQINDINLLPFWLFDSGTPYRRINPVVYPTTGCPWFTISTENKYKYLIGDDNPIHYYFIKDNDNSTIAIRFCDGHGQLADVWQVISFGKLENTFDKYNINQLYCVGGNTALSPDTWVYYSQSHVEGLSYDLNFKNPALTNSNFLHPTKLGSANISNFRIMSNSGEWQDIYAHSQTFSTYQYFTLAGTIYQWGVPLNPPTDYIGSSNHTAYPFGSSIRDKLDSYCIRDRKYIDNYHSVLTSSGQLDKVTFYLYDNDDRNGV